MEGPKGWREFCRMAGTAILKFETDKHELLEVTIFADRTSCRDSLWMASFQYGNGLSIITLSGDADSDAYEDSILCKMAELSNAVMDGSPIYSPYGITFSPVSYSGYKIIREVASERAIDCGFNKVLKWKDFPEEIKGVFRYIPEEDDEKPDTCAMIKEFFYRRKSWFYIAAVMLGITFLCYCAASFFR
ncbi:hypothetical protein [Succiniclasticum ruminis]|nr:hypothetical protein [Succiniclasticum ruminis]